MSTQITPCAAPGGQLGTGGAVATLADAASEAGADGSRLRLASGAAGPADATGAGSALEAGSACTGATPAPGGAAGAGAAAEHAATIAMAQTPRSNGRSPNRSGRARALAAWCIA